MTWFLLGPGPSMSRELAERFMGRNVGAVGNTYQLAPWAGFMCATDAAWWRAHPDAINFEGRKFSPNKVSGVEQAKTPLVGSSTNSGVLGLECCKRLGAERIVLVGFDFGSGHFFGPYTNGLRNTVPARRKVHQLQFTRWRKAHKGIEVLNATRASALTGFRMIGLDEVL